MKPSYPDDPKQGREIESGGEPFSLEEPIDRYHYVDDVYSGSPKKRPHNNFTPDPYAKKPKKPKKKMRGIWKALIWIGSILLALLIAVGVAVGLLFFRMHTESVDTARYVETPTDSAAYAMLDDPDLTNILIIGADRNQDGTDGRSDSMMLASINSKTKKLKLVSFLRDLYVDLGGTDYGYDRLNAAYSYGGAAMLMQTIENNFRIKVDKYIETNFAGFEDIIDAIGGIDITMTAYEANFLNEWKQVGAVEGENHLNGENALYFARMRKLDSDFGRTTRQRQVMNAVFSKLKGSNPFTMYAAAFQLAPNLTTNLSPLEFTSFGLSFLQAGEAESLSVPSDGTYYDYTTDAGAMVLVPYYDSIIPALQDFLRS